MSHPADSHTEDSAGVPWAGRVLTGTGFDDDRGEADPEVVAALVARAGHPSASADAHLVAVAAEARWLVPVVAVLGEGVRGPDGAHTVEKTTDMAVVTLTAPDGRRALPIFTSATALAAWDAVARPVPVTGARAAQAALAEGCTVLVVDVADAVAQEVRPSMVWALARGVPWEPAHTDLVVAQGVSRAVADRDEIVEHWLEEGDPTGSGQLRVVLRLRPGLDADALEGLASRVGEQLAGDDELRVRVDDVTFRAERA